MTENELSAAFGTIIFDGSDNCYYCHNPLLDGECIFCTHHRAIQNGISCLFAPDQIVELRALRTDGSPWAGLYTDHTRLAEDIATISADPIYKGCYYTLNPISRSWLAEVSATGYMAVNGYRRASVTTKDVNIESRRWLLLDFDPVRFPSNLSSTDGELVAAEELMYKVANYLNERNWSWPLIAKSGNGAHLLYRLDFESNRYNTNVIETVLKVLSERFSTDAVTLDTAVGNPSRICKSYGSITRKGQNDGSRPWRSSLITNFRLVPQAVSLAQLEAIANESPKAPSTRTGSTEYSLDPDFDIDDLIEHFSLDVLGEEQKAEGSVYYHLSECPFAGRAHTGDAKKTSLVLGNSLGFKCFSDDCSHYHIGDFLKLMSAEHGHYPKPIWPQVIISDSWDEGAFEPNVFGVEIAAPVSVPAIPSVVAAEIYPDEVFPGDGYKMPATLKEKLDEYVSPENFDGSKYAFPEGALYGWLGDKTRTLDCPLGWSYIAMLTAFAAQGINGHLSPSELEAQTRPTLYSVLLGPPGSGKSLSMRRALATIPPTEHRLRKVATPASEYGLFKIYVPGKNDPVADPDFPDTYLGVMDEFINVLNKVNIGGSCLGPVLNSLWYENVAGAADKSGYHEISAKLNILGAMPVTDPSDFTEKFGKETTTGLYTRFLFGVGPSNWNWNHGWVAQPELRTPSKVHLPASQRNRAQNWVSAGQAEGKFRGRLGEQALRVAVISASANHDSEVTPACLDAALKFAEWQELIRQDYKPGVSETVEGKISSAIEDAFEALRVKGVSRWVGWWDLSRSKSWSRKFGADKIARAKNALIDEGTLVEELFDPEDEGRKKSNRTGFLRLRNAPGVEIEPSPSFKKRAPKKLKEKESKAQRSGRGDKSIGGVSPAMDDEVSSEVSDAPNIPLGDAL